MRVILDTDKCCGAGQCVLVAPEIFDQRDEDGIAVLLQERPSPELHVKAIKAAKICPGVAIQIKED
jgi:ferredoxin